MRPPPYAPRALQIAAAVIGNALEWYDFVVFGFVAVVLARQFFPAASPYAALLLTFATFGAGFFMRPVGAITLGLLADRAGRKAALQLVMLLMTVAVALIAFAPAYDSIGIAAPVVVLAARLLQGFATGGEFASATSFLIETAPPGRRGLYGSLQYLGQALAALLGALAGAAITHGLSAAQLEAWGWRLPFLAGLLIGPVGLYIRRKVPETAEFLALRAQGAPTLRVLLGEHRRAMAGAFLLVACSAILYYVLLLYVPTYAHTELHLRLDDAFGAQLMVLGGTILLIPPCGALSDRIGRRPMLLAGALGCLVLAWPIFAWLDARPSFARLLAAQAVLCGAAAVYWGPLATAVAEQFPARVRSSGSGIAYNFAVLSCGGFAPFLVTWLIRATGSPLAPAFYVMCGAAAGVCAALLLVSEPGPTSGAHPGGVRHTHGTAGAR